MSYLTTEPIFLEKVKKLQFSRGEAGAMVSFVGLVRADRHDGRMVKGLVYEAYPEMAECKIDQLITEARIRWSLKAIYIQHRLGYVEVDQISVVVLVAAAHRAESYAASQFLIERIKHDVPIWKKELYDDGTSKWSSCTQKSDASVEERCESNHAYV